MLDKPSWRALSHAQKVAVIRDKWTDGGMTARQIAAMYSDATHNSIIGTVHRANLHRGRVVQVKSASTTSPRTPRNHRIKIVKMPSSTDELPDGDIPKAKLWSMINGNRPPLPGFTPIALLDLPTRGRCKFPVQGGYCGAPSDGDKSYCATHYAVCYVPVPPKKAKAEDAMILGHHPRSVRRS